MVSPFLHFLIENVLHITEITRRVMPGCSIRSITRVKPPSMVVNYFASTLLTRVWNKSTFVSVEQFVPHLCRPFSLCFLGTRLWNKSTFTNLELSKSTFTNVEQTVPRLQTWTCSTLGLAVQGPQRIAELYDFCRIITICMYNEDSSHDQSSHFTFIVVSQRLKSYLFDNAFIWIRIDP